MYQGISLAFVFIATVCNSIKNYPPVTIRDVETLRIEIRNAIDESTMDPVDPTNPVGTNIQPLLASIVRLVFHDCGGRNIKQPLSESSESDESYGSYGSSESHKNNIELTPNRCNGCLDFELEDNAGIEEASFNQLEDIYNNDDNKWYNKMGRADFWVASATIALEYAAENQFYITLPPQMGIPAPLPDIPYYFGRKDCPNSPDAIEKDVFNFPDANGGWKDTFSWFKDNFNFNERETVTIIGAHTLGHSRTFTSGYINSWAGFPNILNVEFYANIADIPTGGIFGTSYIQKDVEDIRNCNGCKSDKMQWILNNEAIFVPLGVNGLGLNLNSDISLAIKIEDFLDIKTGKVSCTAPQWIEFITNITLPTRCPKQEGVYQIVNEFASNNALWLNEFAQVFELMVTINEDLTNLKRLIVPYNRCFEDN